MRFDSIHYLSLFTLDFLFRLIAAREVRRRGRPIGAAVGQLLEFDGAYGLPFSRHWVVSTS